MQHLIPSFPIKGDPSALSASDFGSVYNTLGQINRLQEKILDEVWFDGVEITPDGKIFLICEDDRVSSARMSSRHADAHLVLGDPS